MGDPGVFLRRIFASPSSHLQTWQNDAYRRRPETRLGDHIGFVAD